MADNQAAESLADDAAQSQADTQARTQADRSDTQDATETISLEKAKELRQEAAGLRKRIKDAEARVQAAEAKAQEADDKDKSAVERLTGERDRLKADIERLDKDIEAKDARVRDLAVSQALMSAATKAGARYPDLLMERLAKRAEVDGDLAVTNADDLVKDAKAQYPALFSAGKADGGARDESAGDEHVKPGLGRLQHAYATESKTKRSR